VRLRPASLYALDRDVVLIPLGIVGLEREVEALGVEWRRKHEFHVTAVSAKRVARLLGSDPAGVWDDIEAELSRHEIGEITVRGDELRLVREEDNRTLVAMAEVEGLPELYASLSERFGTDIEPPPAHVTLYTNPGGEGIGLHDADDLRTLTRRLEGAEVSEVRRATGLDRLG
jgi:hypothetical protein